MERKIHFKEQNAAWANTQCYRSALMGDTDLHPVRVWNETLPLTPSKADADTIQGHQAMWCKTTDLWPLYLLQFVSNPGTAPTPGQSHTNSNVVLTSKGCQAVQIPSFGNSWAKHRLMSLIPVAVMMPKGISKHTLREKHMSYMYACGFRVTVNSWHRVMDKDSGQRDRDSRQTICSGFRF